MIRKYIHSFAWWLYDVTRGKGPPQSPSNVVTIEVRAETKEAMRSLDELTAKIKEATTAMENLGSIKGTINGIL